MVVMYSSNNSGGEWWLRDEDWYRLEASGWKIQWVRDREELKKFQIDGRWLGALATRAFKEFASIDDAIEEWSLITKKDPEAMGCDCCGRPHWFSEAWEDE